MPEVTPRLKASEWQVLPVPDHQSAVRCITLWHYSQSAPNTSTYRHGLYPASGQWGDPLGVALWIPPTRTAAAHIHPDSPDAVLSLSRLVVAPQAPKNAASFLLGRSMALIDRKRWPVLVTYADTRLGHTGAIYKATNWESDGEVAAGDVWVGRLGEQRGRKRGGVTLTASQMRELGFEKAPPLPKIRYVHRVASCQK